MSDPSPERSPDKEDKRTFLQKLAEFIHPGPDSTTELIATLVEAEENQIIGAESRAISPQGTAAAAWMLNDLGPGNRIAADRSNRPLLGSVGDQRVVFDGRDPIELWPLYDAPTIDGVAADTVRQGDIRYVLVDRRLSTALPMDGLYFDQKELQAGHQAPISSESLAKFDRDNRVDRIYDSGVLQIYDTSWLAHGP